MPRSGGIYTLPPGYFAVDGTTIEVSQHNPPMEDIAEALTDSLPRDGSAPMTGNLPMGGNKITGGAVGTNPTDFALVSQLPTFTPTTGTLTAGTNAQGQGPITTDQVTITVAAVNPSGVTLPTAVAAKAVIIANRGANPVNIYPATGASIGALAANAPVLLAVNQSVEFFARGATQWEGQISQPLDASLTEISALSLVRGDLLRVGVGGVVERLPKGTAGQLVGYDADDVLPVSAPTSAIQWQAEIPVTSGTSASLSTSIPAGVTELYVRFIDVSPTLTNDHVAVRIGPTGGLVATGYSGGAAIEGNSFTSATGFGIYIGSNTRIASGMFTMFNLGSNKWHSEMTGILISSMSQIGGFGEITLAGPVTQIGIALVNAGTLGVFDSGTWQVGWRLP